MGAQKNSIFDHFFAEINVVHLLDQGVLMKWPEGAYLAEN